MARSVERSVGDPVPARWRWGVVGVFVAFALAHLFVVEPLRPIDERAHVGYALALAEGRLPTIDEPLPIDRLGRSSRRPRNSVWVANHPPLYYALVAGPIAATTAVGGDIVLAVRVGRAVSVVLAAFGTWMVFDLLRLLVPKLDRATVIASVAVLTVTPGFVHVMALVHNDALAFVTSTGTLVAGGAVARHGWSRSRGIGLCLWSAAATATRLSGLFAVVVALGMVVAVFAARPGAPTSRWRVPALAALGVAASVAASSGWFFLRNIRLYGDVSGAAVLLRRFGRRPNGTPLEVALDPGVWGSLLEQSWVRFAGGTMLEGGFLVVPTLVTALAVVGLAVAAASSRPRRWDSADRVLLAGALAYFALLVGSTLAFHAQGGSLHARYLFPGLWLPAFAVALGLRRWGAITTITAIAALAISHVAVLAELG